MMISPEQFWDSLESSGFLPASKISSLKTKIAAKPNVAQSAVHIARALIANKLLTEDQARSLLAKPNESREAEAKEGVAHEFDFQAPAQESVVGMPHLQGVTTSTAQKAAEQSKPARTFGTQLPLWIGIGMVAIIAVAAFFFWPDGTKSPPAPATARSTESIVPPSMDDSPYELIDSEDALWARPRPGAPLEFSFLPPGTQVIVRVRLAELLATADGPKVIRSLGPAIEKQLGDWTSKIGVAREDLSELHLYLLPQGTTQPQVILFGELETQAAEQFAKLGQIDDQQLIKLATNGVWCPRENPQSFYYGPWNVIKEYPSSESGRLRRELQQLHAESHDTDLVSILANPNFLRDEAQGLFPDTRKRLLDGLFSFWSDEAQAVSLGFQQSDLAFIEVRMITRDDLQPRHLAAKVNAFLTSMPSRVRDFLGVAILDQHWQPLAMRFPQMVSYVVDQSRVVVDGKQVAMAAIAPSQATHNLLLASELGLATPVRDTTTEVADNSQLTLQDVLASKTSVRFAQKSLDEAAQDIAQQIREERAGLPFDFRIQIIGSDLEPEGITRNQQIRDFQAVDVPLADVLTALMSKANPEQNVTDPKDARQKLVWVKASDPGLIHITTRTAAKTKKLALPDAFR